MKLGEVIQKKRLECGLSQEKLAEQVGVSRQAVSKWEVNDALPDTDKLVPLARALGITVDELLGNAALEEPQPYSSGNVVVPEKHPSWLSMHWFWLGLIPAAWGVLYIVFGCISVNKSLGQLRYLLEWFPEGTDLGPLSAYVGPDGTVTLWSVLPNLLPDFLLPGLAVIVGMLIFFLGKRHVREKYGRQ